MSSVPKWGGRRAQQWRANVLSRCGRICALNLPGCTREATTADHIVPRSVDLSRQYDVTNGRPACMNCNRKRSDGRNDRDLLVVDNRAFFDAVSPTPSTARPAPAVVDPRPPGFVRFAGDAGRQ